MTTAPTPSDAERLAMVLRSACALSHPRFGTDARFVEMLASQAQAVEKELRRLQAENERLRAELEARKPLPLSNDERLRLRSDVARAIWDVMREHEDRCGHALEDVEPKHQVWDCADAAIKAVHGITGGSS